jgi:hypothetical protein
MAAVNWLCVPLKRSSNSEVDFRKPLEKFIKSTFSTDIYDELKDRIGELNKLRSNAVNRAPERHQSSLDTLLRYILHNFIILLQINTDIIILLSFSIGCYIFSL